MATGLCADCRRDDAAKENAEQVRREEQYRRQFEAERAQRAKALFQQLTTEPLDGLVLIGISVAAAIVGWLLIGSGEDRVVGFIFIGIAGMLYLAGVIRWAVSGSQLLQFSRLQRQNAEIIELLKVIADKGRT